MENKETMLKSLEMFKNLVQEQPLQYAAIKALGHCIQNSEQTTTTGLTKEFAEMKKKMIDLADKEKFLDKTTLPLIAALNICEHIIYKDMSKYQTESMHILQEKLSTRLEQLLQITQSSRKRVAYYAKEFIKDGQTILTHGHSKVVEEILLTAAEDRRFKVIVTESRPKNFGLVWKSSLEKKNIPTKMVLDSALGSVIPNVDYILVGAEAVVQNGGIVNYIGTLSAAMCAKSFMKPCYVAAESLKFLNIFPLSMKDFDFAIKQKVEDFENPLVDFTPPEYITLLFTDLLKFS